MRALTTFSHTRYSHWLSRWLLLIMLIGLVALVASQELKFMRPAKAAFFASRFVATTGVDNTDCSMAGAPCLTINYAILQAMAGDTINVAAGTYNGPQVLINKSLNVIGAGAATTIIDGLAAAPPTGGLVRIETPLGDTGNVLFSGFTVTNPGTGGGTKVAIFAKPLDPATTATISNNKILGVNSGDNGIYSYRSRGAIVFDHNEITNVAFNGVLIEEPLNSTDFHHNTISVTGTSSSYFNMTYESIDVTTLQRVADNTINSPNATAITFNTAPMFVSGPSRFGKYTNVQITNNVITQLGAGRSGIALLNDTTDATGVLGAIENPVITGNNIVGTDAATSNGIRFRGLVTNATITSNNLRDTERGFFGDVAGAGHSATGTQAHFNRIVSNTNGIVWNGAALVNAENNWWGCNYGPGAGGTGCAGTANGITGNTDATPWLVLGLTAVPNLLSVGGNSDLTADLTINSANANTSGTIPNGTPVAFAGTLGTVAPTNTTTTSGLAMSTYTATMSGMGSASTTVDGQTVSTLITIAGFNSSISDPLICTGDNNTLNVHAELVNPNNNPAGFSFTAPILAPLSGVPGTCVSSLGNCTITNNAVTVTGTIPALQSVVVDYKVRVANGTPLGTNLCIISTGQLDIDNNGMFDTNAMVTACTLLNCPSLNQPANTAISDQKAGSVLVFPYYTSNVALQNDTRLSISNIGEQQTIVHIFFIDGTSCNQADLFLCLTPNASFSFKTSEYDPEMTGWLLAVAVNANGNPIRNNSLIGNAFVRDGDYVDNYGAEAFRANSAAVAAIGNGVATLFFDGGSYDAVPSQLAVEIQSPLDAAGQQIVTVGLRGDLTTSQMSGAGQVGTGQAFNEKEVFGSFNNWLIGTCQARATISTASPRVPNGLGNLIKSGQAGLLKFNVGAAVGLIMTPRTATWKGIRTLHKTGLTTSTITIPIITPVC